MTFSIPIYVEERREPDKPHALFTVRPLFFDEPARSGEKLARALTRLATGVRQRLGELAREPLHDELAQWTFAPELEEHWLDLRIETKAGSFNNGFLFVTFRALDRRVAFTPSVPTVHFELLKGQDLRARATEVLTRHFRDEAKDDDLAETPADIAPKGKAWLTTLDLQFEPPLAAPKEKEHDLFAFLGGREIVSGADELESCGRCLDHLYPDELDRVALREREIAGLQRALSHPDHRPVLLVGPRQAGKTALIHEVVWRRVHERKQKFVADGNVWLLSPQRLISGMSFVGQWENRLLAILDEAKKRGHVLCFDDLPGLALAGVCRDSSLSVAHVLKPWIGRRDVRVLAEITPEALRVLREKDRAFADLFHILPVHEPPEPETLRILVSVQRDLEEKHRARFELEALPTVMDLQRRYATDLAFPGKAAGFLRQLAVKFPDAAVTRDTVLAEFQAKSGLALAFLDQRVRVERRDVLDELRRDVVGQDAALDALADVLAVARARLNDPQRPLGSLLFLGPTGVGKTQCAKAVAKLVFGDEDRLVRFDMNEFLTASSVAALTGTADQPEGLLTSAVRRQPFCVLLLDEIEKAHPDVFDLLLSVLGEGRLTDALGRTANFTNALIILTSNLGSQAARSRPGFRNDAADEGAVFVEAAEKFFRPEFFNRLDRVVAFQPLGFAEIERIARRQMQAVFERDGLRQRRVALRAHPEAMAWLVRQGFHPQLGARALKRVIERHLAQPVAERLAMLPPGAPTVLNLHPRRGEIAVHVQALVPAEKRPLPPLLTDAANSKEVLARIEAAVMRLEETVKPSAPRGRVPLDNVPPELARYFAAMEQSKRVRVILRRLAEQSGGPRGGRNAPAVGGRGRLASRRRLIVYSSTADYKWQQAAEQFRDVLQDFSAEPRPLGDDPVDRLVELAREAALLQLLATAAPEGSRAVLCKFATGMPAGLKLSQSLKASYVEMFNHVWGCTCMEVKLGAERRAPARPGKSEATRTRATERPLTPSLPMNLPAPTLISKDLQPGGSGAEIAAVGGPLVLSPGGGEGARPAAAQAEAVLGAPVESLREDERWMLLLEGPGALELARAEAGTELFVPHFENVLPIQHLALPLGDGEEPVAALRALLDRRAEWLAALADGNASVDDDPMAFAALIRIYEHEGRTLDLRSGLACHGVPNAEELRTFLLAQLPLPRELTE